MNKHFVVFSVIFALFSLNVNAGGIGILDTDKIGKEALAMRDIQNQITKKQDEYQKEVTKRQTALDADQKKIESKKNTFSKEALDKELITFDKKVEDFKTFVDKKQNSLKKASMDSMGKVTDKMREIIADISKEKNLDLIVSSTQAIYFKEELDISDEVLKRLDKKITKVSVKFE